MTVSGHPSLTEIERQILDYMVLYLRRNTYQPSIREIGREFGIKSTKTVSEHLQALAEKGYLERDPSRSRGVRILGVDLTGDAVSVPCFDRGPGATTVAAEGRMTLDPSLASVEGTFLVRAQGDELAALGIQDRDWIIVEPRPLHTLASGTTVALRRGERLEFYRLDRGDGGAVELHSTRVGLDGAPVKDPRPSDVIGSVTAMIRRLDAVQPAVTLTAH